jgi:RNA polymerase sigma-70 factor, ECF subfamily
LLFPGTFALLRTNTQVVDDGTLLARAGRGDEEAFAELYARHQGPLYRYASHMCGDAADDIVQDTFLAVIRRPRGYDASRG